MGRVNSKTLSVTAPVGGWNVRDSLQLMKPTEAVYMENWWPTPVDVQIRKGYVNWSTGLPGTVDTLIAYNGVSGTKKLWAFTSTGSVYDVSASGAVGAAVITGLSNGQWQYVAYANSGGNYIIAANGSDWMLRYDGTKWVAITDGASTSCTLVGNGTVVTVTRAAHGLLTGNTVTVSGCATVGYNVGPVAITRIDANTFSYANATTGAAGGTPAYVVGEAITGVSPKNVFSLNIFKQRLWLVQKNSMSAWYLATLAIQGAATEYPLGSLYPAGGYLQSMGTWTIDVGIGIDDNCAFFSSEGEILIYKGTDPSSATTFALVGLFKQGNPIGTRCQIKYLGDVYVITDIGVQPMSSSILTAQVTIKSDVTDKILPAMQSAVTLGRTTFGWQLLAYPSANMLIVNVPNPSGSNYQFAMNTITGAWTKFTGWNARCWESQGNSLYFGGTGVVGLAWSTNADNGTGIYADCLAAFNRFGSDTQLKKFNMMRPIIYSDGSPSFLLGVNLDYDQVGQPSGTYNYAAGSGMSWGSMTWGSMTWGGSLVPKKDWQFAGGLGYSAAVRIKALGNVSEVRWASIDYLVEYGGTL